METCQLVCRANQLTGFYMMGILVVKGLRGSSRASVRASPYIEMENDDWRILSSCLQKFYRRIFNIDHLQW